MKEETKHDEPKLIWRLQERPTVENISKLVEQGIIDKFQAKKLLFEETTQSQVKNLNDIQNELKLLRELVMKLSERNSGVYPIIIREVEEHIRSPWIQPYATWTNATSGTTYQITS